MKVHYLNAKGEERMLDGIMHLQNMDNERFIAATESEKELTLLVDRIEGIADSSLLDKKGGCENDQV